MSNNPNVQWRKINEDIFAKKELVQEKKTQKKRAICIGTSELHRHTEQKMEIEEYI